MNNVVLMGRICAEPELKYTTNQIPVTSFNLAVNRDKEKADFIPVVAWRQTAEFICKYFGKGSLIALKGSIQSRTYDDKYGNKRTAIEVVAEHAYFTGEKKEESKADVKPGDDFEEIIGDDSLPF